MANTKYKRGSDGYFKTNVWDGTYTDTGKKHYLPLRTKKSSKELERLVHEHNEKINQRRFVRSSDVTFQAYARSWLLCYKQDAELNTIKMYHNCIEKHFASLTCSVNAISRGAYVAALNSIKGNRTKQIFQMTFKQVLRSAIHDKLLPAAAEDDILSDIPKIKCNSEEKRPLTAAEKKAISKCKFRHKRDEVFLNLLYYTGMRGEEIRALTIFDISIPKAEISITKAVVFANNDNTAVLKGTKNGITRTIQIPDALVRLLSAYMSTLHDTKLFSMGNGDYITKSSYRKMWKRVLDEMQRNCDEPISGLTPHIFRHNYCTTLCRQIPNISISKIADLLGDSEKMVLEVYNHLCEENEKAHDVVTAAFAL